MMDMDEKRRGFTLVEIIVAGAILVALLASYLVFFSSGLRTSQKNYVSVAALTDMNLIFNVLREDVSKIIIDRIRDDSGEVREVTITTTNDETDEDGEPITDNLTFYRVYTVIPEIAKPVSGKISYDLEKKGDYFSLKRSLLGLEEGEVIREKSYLRGSIRSFKVDFFRLVTDEATGTVIRELVPPESIDIDNIPDLIHIRIVHKDESRVEGILTISSPYIFSQQDRQTADYCSNWLVISRPAGAGGALDEDGVTPTAPPGAINLDGPGTAISPWDYAPQ